MIDTINDWLARISGCKERYEFERDSREAADATIADLEQEIVVKDMTIAQLQLLVPGPPPPKITYIVEKDDEWMQRVLGSIMPNNYNIAGGAGFTRLTLDTHFYLTDKSNFRKILTWVGSSENIKHKFNCENIAFDFTVCVARHFGLNQDGVVLDYTSGHSYNIVLFPDESVCLVDLKHRPGQLIEWKGSTTFYTLNEESYVLI